MTQVPAVPENGTVATTAPLSPEIAAIVGRAKATGQYVGGASFVMQALDAATLEEATDIGAVISGKEHVGERIQFRGVQFLDSDPELEGDIPLFALCDIVREAGDGVVEKMSIGAGHVLGLMIRACEMDWFPFDAELVPVPLGKGRTAINLKLAPRKVPAWEG